MAVGFQPKLRSRTQRSTYLVDKEHGVPARCEFERLTEACVEVARTCSQISTPNNVQGTTEVLACRLCGECFSDTRWPEEVDDEALSFSPHEVVKRSAALVKLPIRFDERAQESLAIVCEHEARKRFVIPVDGGNVVDVEFHYAQYRSARVILSEDMGLTP